MKVKRTGVDCVSIKIAANQVHVESDTAVIFRNKFEAYTLANDILDALEPKKTQADVDASMGADEYKSEKAL